MFYCEDNVHVDGGLPEYIFEYRSPESYPSLGATFSKYESYRKWCSIVGKYSSMDISLPSDILPAISAVAETFGPKLSVPSTLHESYKAGLWEQHFPLNLLWCSVSRDTPKPLGYRAPSWSWAAVDSAVFCDWNAWVAIHLGRIAVRSITCKMQLASPEAPFGQVIGGYLEIEAPLTELTFQYKPNTIHFDFFGGIWAEIVLDAPRTTFSGGQDPYETITVSVLCIVREARTLEEKEFVQEQRDWPLPATHMQGLIVGKTHEENVYTRLGRFTIQWEESLNNIEAVQDWEDWKSSFVTTRITIV
jgi:hypothetical protein